MFKWVCAGGEGHFAEIPCIFPVIRELPGRDAFAEPPSTSGGSAKTRVTLNRDGWQDRFSVVAGP